jgi:hypothetical protein
MTYPVKANISQNFGDNPTANIRPGSPDYWIIQQFGNYQPDGHTGVDFACAAGTEVRAVADGTVLHIGWVGGTYADNPWWIAPGFAGYCAVIDHGSFIGIYGHCTDGSAKVGKGARVRDGQVFILSGNTGGSTGAHLHFEVLPDGYNLNARFYGRVNPLPYLGSASVGPAGETTTTTEEDDFMTSMHDFLQTPAFTGGPTISEMFVKVNAVHDAIFKNDGSNKSIVGGESLPSLTNKNDLKILEALEELASEVAALKEGDN